MIIHNFISVYCQYTQLQICQWFISVYCQCAQFLICQWFISVYCQSVFLSGVCATTDVGRTSRREFTLVREVRTTTVSRRLRKTDWCLYSVFVFIPHQYAVFVFCSISLFNSVLQFVINSPCGLLSVLGTRFNCPAVTSSRVRILLRRSIRCRP